MSAIGSTLCTAGFPSAAIASNCLTARCASIWYGFFIATLLFLGKRKLLLAYQGFGRGVATFYDLPGISRQNAPSTSSWGGTGFIFLVQVESLLCTRMFFRFGAEGFKCLLLPLNRLRKLSSLGEGGRS